MVAKVGSALTIIAVHPQKITGPEINNTDVYKGMAQFRWRTGKDIDDRDIAGNGLGLAPCSRHIILAVNHHGSISAGHARALLGARDPEAAAAAVVKKSLNVRQTEALIRREQSSRASGERSAGPTKDPNTSALERDLGNLLGLKVEIDERGEAGILKFHYQNLEQLDDVLQRLMAATDSR